MQIEGLFSVLVGVMLSVLFPISASNPRSLTGIRYFSERESQILARRVILDDPSKQEVRHKITWSELRDTLSNWKLLPHIILTVCGLCPGAVFVGYAPTLINVSG